MWVPRADLANRHSAFKDLLQGTLQGKDLCNIYMSWGLEQCQGSHFAIRQFRVSRDKRLVGVTRLSLFVDKEVDRSTAPVYQIEAVDFRGEIVA